MVVVESGSLVDGVAIGDEEESSPHPPHLQGELGYFRGRKKGRMVCGREGGQRGFLSVNGQGGAVRGRGLAERCNRRDGIAEQSSARI